MAMDAHQKTMRRIGRILTALLAAVLLTLTACSSTGGKPRSTGEGMAAGQADTPRFTIAMVTHGPPGDTFWDLIRKGAETAAAKDNIELKYSAELEAPNQANLVQNAIDSKADALAVTLAKPEALAGAVKSAVAAGIPVVAFNAGIDAWQALGVKAYFGQDEKISGEAAGKRLASEGAKKVVCIIQDQGNVALESRCAGVKAGFGGAVENLNVNGTDMPSVQSTIAAKLQQDPSIDRGAGGRHRRQPSADRHLRHQCGTRRRDKIRRRAVGGRPATVPPGLPRRGLAVAVSQQPQHHRRRSARADRTGVHRQDEHRGHRRIREERNALITGSDVAL
jgi:ABC-type sugar transport system substrate-binding protein